MLCYAIIRYQLQLIIFTYSGIKYNIQEDYGTLGQKVPRQVPAGVITQFTIGRKYFKSHRKYKPGP